MGARTLAYSFLFALLNIALPNAPSEAAVGCEQPFETAGVPDEIALPLANRFAPIVLYAPDEPNLPMDVSTFLQQAELWFYSDHCHPSNALVGRVNGSLTGVPPLSSCKAGGEMVSAVETRSASKDPT